MPLSLLSLMLVVFSLTTGEFVIAGILPDVAADLSVSVSAAGLLVTAYAVGMIVGGPVITIATARLARKPLIIGLIAVAVLANLGSAVAPNYAVLLITRGAAGLVVATFFAVAIATAVSTAPPDRQSAAVAKVALGMNLGIILGTPIGTPIGTLIGQSFGWRATFATVGVFAAGAVLMVLRFVPVLPVHATGPVLPELRVFANRDVQMAIALTAVGNVGLVMVFSYIAPLLTEVAGFADGAVPILLLVYGVGAVIGNFLGGWLADKSLLPSVAGLLGCLAAALMVMWAVGADAAPVAASIFVIGVFGFAIIPGMQTRVMATASAAPTLAIAVNASGFQLAAAFAGWLGGRVGDSAWGLRSIYLVGALLTFAGLVIAVYMVHRDRRPVLTV
ncbi:MFS transporter [Nocardia sp. NBC_01009]|uniref:MFS transporter n=1 Tax=Nocardia sp. NBC_01009 TaxID=2975996 RepID=UPI00386DFCB9|nr:MFS transporter [Nocardia sp. NBC_01009]